MKNKIQIMMIHGGMTFKNKKDYLQYLNTRKVSLDKKVNYAGQYMEKELGTNFQIIRPRMPLQDNAKYEEWKIIFERYIPHLHDNVILIGGSLGGIFLAKYLSENKFPKKILSIFLTCPPFDDTIIGEDLVGGFKLESDLSLLEKSTSNLHLLFSKDDNIVPVSHAKKYANKLKKAEIIIFESKNGHFDVPKFPELIKMIKSDVRNVKN